MGDQKNFEMFYLILVLVNIDLLFIVYKMGFIDFIIIILYEFSSD